MKRKQVISIICILIALFVFGVVGVKQMIKEYNNQKNLKICKVNYYKSVSKNVDEMLYSLENVLYKIENESKNTKGIRSGLDDVVDKLNEAIKVKPNMEVPLYDTCSDILYSIRSTIISVDFVVMRNANSELADGDELHELLTSLNQKTHQLKNVFFDFDNELY